MRYRYTKLGYPPHGAEYFTHAITQPLDPNSDADDEAIPIWVEGKAGAWKAKARKPGTMQTFTPFSSEQRTRDEAVQAALELARAGIWD